MDINIKLNKNFVTQFNKMLNEYGEEMAKLNGFADKQLSYTDFIDNFVDKENISDTSIDGNANVTQKDIVTLEREMAKPHSKLLAFNKIYYELNKQYDFKTANEWLQAEWVGNFYMHDAPSSTYKSYCVLPQECCSFILNGKYIYTSLQYLYNLLVEEENIDEENLVYYKRPKNLKVLDYDKETASTKYTKVLLISNRETDKDFYFTKVTNGSNLITTEDHLFISTDKDIPANQLETREVLYSTFDNTIFTNSLDEYNGLSLTEDMGWLIGVYLAEGYNSKGQLTICQSKEKSPSEWAQLINILEKNKMPYTLYPQANSIRLKNGDNNWERKILKIAKGKLCNEKMLCEDFIHFNDNFLKGLLAGIIDGDGTIAENRTCMIRLTSRTLINQLRLIGLHYNVYFAGNTPYIQSQTAKIQQKRPMHSANVNMNRNKEFFLSLPSRKVQEKYTHFDYNEKYANLNYKCEMGEVLVKDTTKTYKSENQVFDLSTESHSFICNEILVHNCFAYDLESLVNKGLFFIKNFNSQPPKHLSTYTDFVSEFISYNCNRTSGATGIPSFLIYAYYFWKQDCNNNYYVVSPEYYRDQETQTFIYRLNQPFLKGGIESSFTNISIYDRPYLTALFGGKFFPDGTPIIEHIEDIIDYQKAFLKVCSKIRSENMMTFPILTFALLREGNKFVDEPFARWCSEHNMQWADSNFFISRDVTVLSNCCRLLGNIKDLGYYNSIGGTALEVGSVKVNTINLARIAYETTTPYNFLKLLESKVILCLKTLHVIRHIIKRNIEKGLLPNYSLGLIKLSSQYNTIGIIGLYEALQKFNFIYKDEFNNTFYTEKGIDFAKEILSLINAVKDDFVKDKDYSASVEQIPGERAAAVLMQKDQFFFPDEQYELPLYGNQWIPLGVKTTLQEKIRLSAILDKACGGGSISHLNLDAPFTDSDAAWKLLNYIADAGVTYFAFNTKISACKHNHGFYGEMCPTCGEKKETTYSRIVGFITAEKTYSKERSAEFFKRQWEDIDTLQELN